MKLPQYMMTCYFCMRSFGERSQLSAHLEVCEGRQAALVQPKWGLNHVGLRPTRNMVGEVVFAREWKRLMETPLEDDDYDDYRIGKFAFIVHMTDGECSQHHASLAASFVTWLGTNCGGCFLLNAKRLAEENHGRMSRANMFLAQWAIENRRRAGVNSGWRTIEHLLYTGGHDSFGNFTGDYKPATSTEYEVLDNVVYWLGTAEGTLFIEKCERLIRAREKGLSDNDLMQIGLNIA